MGRTLGGSTSINGGDWSRGMAAQYDAISSLLEPSEADLGWNFDGLFSYMKKVCSSPLLLLLTVWRLIELKAEGYSAPNAQQRAKGAGSVASYHGTSGPVQVTFPDAMYGGPQQPDFVSTMQALTNITHCQDLNGGDVNCVAYCRA